MKGTFSFPLCKKKKRHSVKWWTQSCRLLGTAYHETFLRFRTVPILLHCTAAWAWKIAQIQLLSRSSFVHFPFCAKYEKPKIISRSKFYGREIFNTFHTRKRTLRREVGPMWLSMQTTVMLSTFHLYTFNASRSVHTRTTFQIDRCDLFVRRTIFVWVIMKREG